MGLYYHERKQIADILRRYIREEGEEADLMKQDWLKILQKFEDNGIGSLSDVEHLLLNSLIERAAV